jgi:hypothetical protein
VPEEKHTANIEAHGELAVSGCVSRPMLLYQLRPMSMVMVAIVVLGQVKLPLPQLREESTLHLAAPPVQPLHGFVILLWGAPVEECLGVDPPASGLLELDTRRGLELREVLKDCTLGARHIALCIIVIQILVHRVPKLVALSPVVPVVAVVRRYVIGDVLTNCNRRLRASNKINSESGEHKLMVNGII